MEGGGTEGTNHARPFLLVLNHFQEKEEEKRGKKKRKKKEATFPDLLGYYFVDIITSSNAKTKRQTTLRGLHLPIAIHDRYNTTRTLGLCRIWTHLHLTSLRRTRDRGRPCYAATVLPYSSGPGPGS
jgi:hypothetical protein